MQKQGQFGENPFHEVEHESKMRFLKAHSHTSEQRGYDVRENAKKKEKEIYLSRKGSEKRQAPKNAALPPAGEGARICVEKH